MELQTDLGWDNYLAEFRSYDPTIGRWGQIDPKANEFVSPYVGMGNNPIFFVDPEGDTIKIRRTNGEGYYTYGSNDKIGKDKQLRKTVRTLNKTQRRGADKLGIIGYLSSHEETITINPSTDWTDRTAVVVGEGNHNISWGPNQGYVGQDGETLQSPALGLLHELAESYYVLADPEGRVAENPAYFKGKQYTPGDIQAIYEYSEQEKRETGSYQTYNDRWIIQNVEPGFNEVFRDRNRNTHKGYGTKATFGPFSKRARKYYDHRTGEISKIRNLKKGR
jgi:RHS repeat-associated protein